MKYERPNEYVDSNWCPDCGLPRGVCDCEQREPLTLGELCQREIVKIRALTLKDDIYTSHLLGDAVGSPIGITACVHARMNQIHDLQNEIETLNTLNRKLIKQVSKMKRTADLDDGFIEFLTDKPQDV